MVRINPFKQRLTTTLAVVMLLANSLTTVILTASFFILANAMANPGPFLSQLCRPTSASYP